jgi:hypothetical protein
MKYFLTIGFLLSMAYGQLPKCKIPVATGNFTPSITLPQNNWTFGIIGQGNNGSGIASYQYSITQGSGTLVNANSQSASITNLTQGITTVMLVIADSCGAKDTSNIIITVNPAVTGLFTITATANPNVMQLPTNSSVLTATSSMPFSIWWQMKSGPAQPTYSNQANATCTISNLVSGNYQIGYSATTTATNPAQTVTGIVVVTVNSQYTLTLVPNPTRSTVVATLTGNGTGSVLMYLYNAKGKLLQQGSTTKTGISASVTFNLTNLVAGTYVVKATLGGKQVATSQVIKQ